MKDEERIKLKNYIFEYSYFSRINTINGNGGIIYLKHQKIDIKFKNCIFYYCSCTEWGGVIYIENGNNIELLKISVSYCFASQCQFAYIETKNNSFYHLLSINNCYNNTNGSFNSWIIGGNISLINYNSSKNINNCGSGIFIYFPYKFNSIFCTIIDNYVSDHSIIWLQSNENNYLSYYNIINNNSPSDCGIIYVYSGKYYLNNSILLNNKNTLFFTNNDGTLEIQNCQINHLNELFKGNIITNNLQLNKKLNSLFIIHYSTKYCSGNYLNYEF